jgi:hypothetical protein
LTALAREEAPTPMWPPGVAMTELAMVERRNVDVLRSLVDFCELRQHSVMIRELLQPTGTQFYNIFKYLVMQCNMASMLGQLCAEPTACK